MDQWFFQGFALSLKIIIKLIFFKKIIIKRKGKEKWESSNSYIGMLLKALWHNYNERGGAGVLKSCHFFYFVVQKFLQQNHSHLPKPITLEIGINYKFNPSTFKFVSKRSMILHLKSV